MHDYLQPGHWNGRAFLTVTDSLYEIRDRTVWKHVRKGDLWIPGEVRGVGIHYMGGLRREAARRFGELMKTGDGQVIDELESLLVEEGKLLQEDLQLAITYTAVYQARGMMGLLSRSIKEIRGGPPLGAEQGDGMVNQEVGQTYEGLIIETTSRTRYEVRGGMLYGGGIDGAHIKTIVGLDDAKAAVAHSLVRVMPGADLEAEMEDRTELKEVLGEGKPLGLGDMFGVLFEPVYEKGGRRFNGYVSSHPIQNIFRPEDLEPTSSV